MKKLLTIISILALVCAVNSFGVLSWSYGWEDGTGTALGTYGNAIVSNSMEQAYEGTHSLKFIEDPLGGTPQAFIWWVTGLNDGDGITASFYVYDTTPSASPSGRIWGHYTSNDVDISVYAGSAGGNDTYSDGSGWTNLQWNWSFDSNGGERDGFVCEARIYSSESNNVIYIDTASIIVSNDNAKIYNAAGQQIPEPFMISLLVIALGALVSFRK